MGIHLYRSNILYRMSRKEIHINPNYDSTNFETKTCWEFAHLPYKFQNIFHMQWIYESFLKGNWTLYRVIEYII